VAVLLDAFAENRELLFDSALPRARLPSVQLQRVIFLLRDVFGTLRQRR